MVTLHFHDELNVMTIAVKGVLDARKVFDIQQQILEHPDYRLGISSLWDFRETIINMSVQEMIEVSAKSVELFEEYSNRMKAAFLVNDSNNYAFLELFNTLRPSNLLAEMKIFYDIDEALTWVKQTSQKLENSLS